MLPVSLEHASKPRLARSLAIVLGPVCNVHACIPYEQSLVTCA